MSAELPAEMPTGMPTGRAAGAADGAGGTAGKPSAPAEGAAFAAGREQPGRDVARTTARPEGGGRAAGGGAPAPARQWPILLVLAGAVAGLVVTATGHLRSGTMVVAAALLVGAVLRWAMTNVGMLAVRSRFTDVITYGVLGALILLLALMAQPDPLIRIPFLEDIIHFSVR